MFILSSIEIFLQSLSFAALALEYLLNQRRGEKNYAGNWQYLYFFNENIFLKPLISVDLAPGYLLNQKRVEICHKLKTV